MSIYHQILRVPTPTIVKLQTVTNISSENTDSFEDLIGVCSDGLYIINKERTEIVDTIVKGISKDCTLFSAPNEDIFLDTISIIRNVLLEGYDPFKVIIFENI